ncbi:MAG: serine/threonine-protein phosphatase [Chitinophagaceae bacterium]|nr:serine/threonine-protein phosphatase [Rubrivivax sp.]
MIRLQVASLSEAGARSRNEDDVRHGTARNGCYAVLADGAGGHSRGAEAAQRTVARIEAMLRDDEVAFSPANLTQTVFLAHAELQQHQGSDSPEARMHCTVVVLWIDPAAQHALWTHVGDSRLYRIRHGRTDVLTIDDSVVQRLFQAGVITAEQLSTHPQKNQLMAALGIEGQVEPHTVVRPVELLEGDAFLLCSDGWWAHFDELALAETLCQALTPQDWLANMRTIIDAQRKPRQDNFSAIAIWAGDPAEVTQPSTDDTLPLMQPLD